MAPWAFGLPAATAGGAGAALAEDLADDLAEDATLPVVPVEMAGRDPFPVALRCSRTVFLSDRSPLLRRCFLDFPFSVEGASSAVLLDLLLALLDFCRREEDDDFDDLVD